MADPPFSVLPEGLLDEFDTEPPPIDTRDINRGRSRISDEAFKAEYGVSPEDLAAGGQRSNLLASLGTGMSRAGRWLASHMTPFEEKPPSETTGAGESFGRHAGNVLGQMPGGMFDFLGQGAYQWARGAENAGFGIHGETGGGGFAGTPVREEGALTPALGPAGGAALPLSAWETAMHGAGRALRGTEHMGDIGRFHERGWSGPDLPGGRFTLPPELGKANETQPLNVDVLARPHEDKREPAPEGMRNASNPTPFAGDVSDLVRHGERTLRPSANTNSIEREWGRGPDLQVIEGGVPPLAREDYDAGRAMKAALEAGTDRRGMLEAARPLINRMRDHYGFTVMRPKIPEDPAVLSRALQETSRGLSLLGIKGPRTYPPYGVYFGRPLGWFEDGYGGKSGLGVPYDVKAEDLANFIRPRLTEGGPPELYSKGDEAFKLIGAAVKPDQALPMDQASRMARAKEMGFDPTTYYQGRGTQYPGRRPYQMVTDNPYIASEFARGSSVGGHVLPLRVNRAGFADLTNPEHLQRIAQSMLERDPARAGRGAMTIDDVRKWLNHDISDGRVDWRSQFIIDSAKDAGFSGIPVREDWGSWGTGHPNSHSLAIFDNRNLRSATAAEFDPARRNSQNLLASKDEVSKLIGAAVEQSQSEKDRAQRIAQGKKDLEALNPLESDANTKEAIAGLQRKNITDRELDASEGLNAINAGAPLKGENAPPKAPDLAKQGKQAFAARGPGNADLPEINAGYREKLDKLPISPRLREDAKAISDQQKNYLESVRDLHRMEPPTEALNPDRSVNPKKLNADTSSVASIFRSLFGKKKSAEQPAAKEASAAAKEPETAQQAFLRLYHGTRNTIDKFDPLTPNDEIGPHLGTLAQAEERVRKSAGLYGAKGFERSAVMPVNAAVKNPLEIRDAGSFQPDLLQREIKRTGKFSKEELAPLQELAQMHESASAKFSNMFSSSREEQLRQMVGEYRDALTDLLAKHGYDGLKYRNYVETPIEMRGSGDWTKTAPYSYVPLQRNTVTSATSGDTLFTKGRVIIPGASEQ